MLFDVPLEIANERHAAAVPALEASEHAIAELAYSIAGRYLGKFLAKLNNPALDADADDMIQAAVLRVVQVADRFDPDRGKAFAWLTQVIKNKFREHLRKFRQYEEQLSTIGKG
ncbi:MAG TPA: sigma factor [Pirellulales bacterium]|nr:sigma factor [Pirellulales bacterium]